MAACSQSRVNVTDRAHRYRAVRNAPEGEKRCLFCGSTRNVEVGHLDGHEEHGEPENLVWTCRSCNVVAANTLKKNRMGRATHQFNPGGATTVGAWANAIGAIVPRKSPDRNMGLRAGTTMTTADAVAMIRATPTATRKRLAAQLAGRYSGRRRNGPFVTFGPDVPENSQTRKRSNLFGFSPKKKTAVKRSSMTLSTASSAAYKAGQQSGDTGQFQSWAASKGLSDRGPWLQKSYDKGVNDGEGASVQRSTKTAQRRYSDRPITTKPLADVQYKGFRIYHQGEGFRTSADRGESEFDDLKQAKRFIDDEVKMRRNPSTPATEQAASQRFMAQAQTARAAGDLTRAASLERLARSRAHMAQILAGQRPNPQHRKRAKRNSADASDLAYERFHGQPVGETVLLSEDVHEHEHLWTLGLLMQIRVDSLSGFECLIDFEDDPPYLCSSEDGKQLYIEAGDQKLDLKALKLDGAEWQKDRMVIGQMSAPGKDRAGKPVKWNLGYQTEKDFDKFETILYQHDLGEETGVRPLLEYEPRNEKLYISGGQYKIKLPLFGTSPGIEN